MITSIARLQIGQEVTVHGTVYVVEMFDTAEDKEARGLRNTAEAFRTHKIRAELGLRRPRGRRLFHAWLYETGTFSYPIQVA